MKILLLLPRPLFPTNTGGRIRILNMFTRLARHDEVHAISLANEQADAEAMAEMRAHFHRYTPVHWNERPKFSPGFYLEFLSSRTSRYPYFLKKYLVPEFRQAIERQCAREQYDLVVCDTLPTGLVMLDSGIRPRVLFQHNVEYVIRQRHWETETNALRKWLLRGEYEKGYLVEGEVCRSCDLVLAVSEQDRETLAREFGIAHVTAVPTGVDTDYFRPQEVAQRRGNLVFVGSMDWYPNEDGIFWFVREVYPLIRRAVPYTNLTVVGRNPSGRLRALAAEDTSVEITGTVEDVRPYVSRAEAVLVPLRIGGGTRIKIFEAMSMGRAVVSTTLGAEGLPVAAGREILLADEPEEFANAVAVLLRDLRRREAVAHAAREKVLRDHSWDTVTAYMRASLAALTRAGGSPIHAAERLADG